MSYFAYSSVRFRVRSGTTGPQVRVAGALLSVYFEAHDTDVEGPLLENGVNFRSGDLEVFIGVNAQVHDNFGDEIFVPVMKAFGALVDVPFSVMLLREGGPPPPYDVVVSGVYGPAGPQVDLVPDAEDAAVDEPRACG